MALSTPFVSGQRVRESVISRIDDLRNVRGMMSRTDMVVTARKGWSRTDDALYRVA